MRPTNDPSDPFGCSAWPTKHVKDQIEFLVFTNSSMVTKASGFRDIGILLERSYTVAIKNTTQ